MGSPLVWCALCISWAAASAWTGRYAMNPDGMSYLDMASEAVRSGPLQLVNGYWSPLYPALLALGLRLSHASAEQEFPLVHAVNWTIFVGVTFCFLFFLRSWLAARTTSSDQSSTKAESAYFVALAFVVFLCATTQMIPLALVSPDLCVCGCVFVAAGLCCRLTHTESRYPEYGALGFALGMGYYAKAAMLPIGLLLLAILFVWPLSRHRRSLGYLGSAAAVFLATCAPLIGLISAREGRLSFGETGRLNYVWYVNHLEPMWQGWTGADTMHGIPVHPPRVILEVPRTLEFGTPVPGTYPLWFDSSYWYEGAKAHFEPKQQLQTFVGNLRHCKPMSSLLAGALALGLLAGWRRKDFALRESNVCLILWPVSACLLYALVHVESRFFSGFLVIFWLMVFSVLRAGLNVRWRAWASAAILASATGWLLFSAMRNPANNASNKAAADTRVVAAGLRSHGVIPGDRLAVVGDGLYSFYARAERARIVAEIPDAAELWRSDCQQLEVLRQRLGRVGVKVLVASDKPASYSCGGWQEIPGTSGQQYSVLTVAAQ